MAAASSSLGARPCAAIAPGGMRHRPWRPESSSGAPAALMSAGTGRGRRPNSPVHESASAPAASGGGTVTFEPSCGVECSVSSTVCPQPPLTDAVLCQRHSVQRVAWMRGQCGAIAWSVRRGLRECGQGWVLAKRHQGIAIGRQLDGELIMCAQRTRTPGACHGRCVGRSRVAPRR